MSKASLSHGEAVIEMLREAPASADECLTAGTDLSRRVEAVQRRHLQNGVSIQSTLTKTLLIKLGSSFFLNQRGQFVMLPGTVRRKSE